MIDRVPRAPRRLPLALAIATVGCVFPFAATAFAAPAVMTAASQAALIFGMVALRSSIPVDPR